MIGPEEDVFSEESMKRFLKDEGATRSRGQAVADNDIVAVRKSMSAIHSGICLSEALPYLMLQVSDRSTIHISRLRKHKGIIP